MQPTNTPTRWPLPFRVWLAFAVKQHGKSTLLRALTAILQMVHGPSCVTIIYDRDGDNGYPGTPTTLQLLQQGYFPQSRIALLSGPIDYLELARIAWRLGPRVAGGCILVVDEIDTAMEAANRDKRHAGKEDGYDRIIHYGAHATTRCTLVGGVRRPTGLGADITAMAEGIFIGKVKLPGDLQWLRELPQGPAIREAAANMERWRFLLMGEYHRPTYCRVTAQPSIVWEEEIGA